MKKMLYPFAYLLFLCSSVNLYSQHQHRITLDPALRPFYHGVESGDPLPDKVILWTRVTPDTGTTADIEVFWEIATDVNFTNVVNYGKTTATEQNHYCVKVDACGLQPSTYYYYMFNALGRNSIVARTKTAPSATADNDSLRFAVVSCASWEHGYFNAYESISNRNDVDAVLHLGDYIYEYAAGDYSDNVQGRTYDPPTECITELGYELRYSQYKLDNQLRRIHQLFPFIAVWDDHETANNAYSDGAGNHTPATEGNYSDRKRNSTSTYFKWMPVRKPDPFDTIRIFRKLRYGKLLDLVMLDTRLYDRDLQDLNARDDSTRHMMGPVERAWFFQQLDDTTTRWKIIGNQVMFAPLQIFGQPVNADQWDGYNYERTLIENHILQNNVKDVVVLTGDIHTSWCNDVPGPNYNANTGAGSVCVEFVGASITSANSPLPVGQSVIRQLNPHMKYVNLADKGYYILDVKKNKTQADYTFVSTVSQLGASNVPGPNYFVNDNERNLNQSLVPVNAPQITAVNPPLLPSQTLPFSKFQNHYVVIDENQQATVNVIPSLQICPAIDVSIFDYPNNGGVISLNGTDFTYQPLPDYNGFDTVGFVICAADTLHCDTVYILVQINSVQDIDSFTVNLNSHDVHNACLHFDDVQATSFASTTAAHGMLILTDSCFSYTPNSTYCGNDVIVFTGCDAANNCDTIVYTFRINHPVSASVVELTLNQNSNINHCLYFEDLCAPVGNAAVIKAPTNGTYTLLNDSCFRYNPFFNYSGDDTMRFIACDTCGINHCDTVTVIFHVLLPNAVQQNNLIVFGVYPNPVNDKLIIQYYLYEAGDVQLSIFDAAGKLISKNALPNQGAGLLHAQLNTAQLPAGSYIIEIRNGELAYRKKVVKD